MSSGSATVQTRCHHKNDFNIQPSVLEVLDGALIGEFSIECDEHCQHLLEEAIRHLAIQRIRILHRSIFEKQRIAFATNAEEYSIGDELSEARKLSAFVLKGLLSNNEFGSSSALRATWSILTENISTWAPYVDLTHIDLFLDCLVRFQSSVQHCTPDEKRSLTSLLADANFYESPDVLRRIGKCIISFVAGRFDQILEGFEGTLLRNWIHRPFQDIVTSIQGHKICFKSDSINFLEEPLQMCGFVLETFNHLQIPIWEYSDDKIQVFEQSMKLEAIIAALPFIKYEARMTYFVPALICSLRHTAARSLRGLHRNDKFNNLPSGATRNDLWQIITFLLNNTAKILPCIEDEESRLELVSSCGTLVESIVEYSLLFQTDLASEAALVLESDLLSRYASGDSLIILSSYSSAVLKASRNLPVDSIGVAGFFRSVKKQIWEQAKQILFSDREKCDSFVWEEALALIAATLRSSSKGDKMRDDLYLSSEDEFVNAIKNILKSDFSSIDSRSIVYLIGSIASCNPSNDARQELVNDIFVTYMKGHSRFKVPMCALVMEMDSDTFSKFLNKLSSTDFDTTGPVAKLEVLHSILLAVKEPKHVEVIARHSDVFLNDCIQVIAQASIEPKPDGDVFRIASSVIIEIGSKRDITTLRERNIARILGIATGTMKVSERCIGDPLLIESQIKAFDSCFNLTSFFLQRFSKQMHSCVASLIVSLAAMLKFSFFCPMPEQSIISCGQKFSRLAELLLPYGEVYKKHVLCLIVQFVDGLRGDIGLVQKKSLLPGIYCLLDIIQEHERMQLNSMLDEMGRALLRSVHEGYKKTHVYKGQ